MNLICLIVAAICFFVGAFRAYAAPRDPPTMVQRVSWTDAGFLFVTLAFIVPKII